jgi:alkylated DNA repair dioxygenase AlkB
MSESICGLEYHDDIITDEEESVLLEHIYAAPWITDLSRRTQHYGYRYPYFGKLGLTPCQDIPDYLQPLLGKINEIASCDFEQVIINEYTPGQGIRPHIDAPSLFGENVVSVSLGSDIIMNFNRDSEMVEVQLKRKSAVILAQDARYIWKHSISPRKKDHGIPRATRVSITFRTVNQDAVVTEEILQTANAAESKSS